MIVAIIVPETVWLLDPYAFYVSLCLRLYACTDASVYCVSTDFFAIIMDTIYPDSIS